MESWAEYLKFFAGIMAMLNPIGALPMFIAFTHNETAPQRKRTAGVAAMTALAVLLISLLVGDYLLRMFGVTIPSFRVGGGLLILLMAISSLQAKVGAMKQTEEEAQEGVEKQQVGVVPLGIPLLAGPGTISAVILYVSNNPGNVLHYAVLCGGILLACTIAWAVFRAAPFLARLMGTTGINVTTRIMGLIMVSIGIEFIASGLKQLFPGLA